MQIDGELLDRHTKVELSDRHTKVELPDMQINGNCQIGTSR